MGKLVLRLPDGSTREFPLERERLTIGRRADNDICLPFPAVSGEHAAVVTILDDSFLEDLGSTNGTTVNGLAITKHFLRDHDEIDIGRHTLVYLSGEFTMPAQASIPEPMGTVAVTENGGATIGGDEATVVSRTRTRERTSIDTLTSPVEQAASTGAAHVAADREPEIRAQQVTRMAVDLVAHNDAPADAPTLEVLDGPSAGLVVNIGREEFVLGRLGVQIAAVRRTPEGFRLVRVEGETSPRVNGTALPIEGALLSIGDEIEVAGTRVLYRPPL
jgi:pSer/pThr/pTyr-binding forkhead associated (FHA) protein